jgi:hypothetical protein
MIATRVALARAWGCSPAELRHLTLDELAAMLEHLDDVARRRRGR